MKLLIKSIIVATVFGASISLSGCSKTDAEKIAEIAEETCGGADKVESVSDDGFTCKK